MTEEKIQQADAHLAAPNGQGFAASRGEAVGDRTAAPTQQERPSQALNGIPGTWTHDEGAYAQCGECGRYSVDPFTLSARPRACECGSKHGWSGSFKRPGPDAKWSGQAPERDAAGVPRGEWGGLSPKQAWWAGYRVGKGLPPDMPRSEAVAADPCWYAECGAPTGQSRTFEAGEATCASNEPDEQNQVEVSTTIRNFRTDLDSSVSQGMAQDAARLDWLDKNIFHRDMDAWDRRLYPNHSMWVLFAPHGHQGSARNIIDAAMRPQPTGERE